MGVSREGDSARGALLPQCVHALRASKPSGVSQSPARSASSDAPVRNPQDDPADLGRRQWGWRAPTATGSYRQASAPPPFRRPGSRPRAEPLTARIGDGACGEPRSSSYAFVCCAAVMVSATLVASAPVKAPHVAPPTSPPVELLIDHVVTTATYPWVAAILTALAAFMGALIAQFFQSRREKAQWDRQAERDRAIRQEERERDRIAWMREDQRRIASDSRSVYLRFLGADHELDFHLKNVDPGDSRSDSAGKASAALRELLRTRGG